MFQKFPVVEVRNWEDGGLLDTGDLLKGLHTNVTNLPIVAEADPEMMETVIQKWNIHQVEGQEVVAHEGQNTIFDHPKKEDRQT